MNAIDKAAGIVGSQAALARMLRVTKARVGQWKDGASVPSKRCVAIEKLTLGAVRCEDLAPDEPWHRVPDDSWPHPNGRPLVDHAAATAAAAQEG